MARRKLSSSEDCVKRSHCEDVSWSNYQEITALEHSALVKIVVELWKHPDIRNDIEKHSIKFGRKCGCRHSVRDKSLRELYLKVHEKSKILDLPGILERRIWNLIPPVGLELLSWIDKDFYRFNSSSIIESLRWTSEGLVDRVETFDAHQKLVYERGLEGFLHVCEYCVEDIIVDVWNSLSKDAQEECLSECKRMFSRANCFVVYWISFVHNQTLLISNDIFNNSVCTKERSIYENMFILAIVRGNLLAVKYFFNKLSDLEVSDSLSKCIGLAVNKRQSCRNTLIYQQNNERTDIVVFLISQVKHAHRQIELIRNVSHALIPALFHDHPWQKYLPPTMDLIWDTSAEDDLLDLFDRIQNQIVDGRSVEPRLFFQLWGDCPIHIKRAYIRHIIRTYHGLDVLWNLLETKNLEVARSIFQFMNDEEKEAVASLLLKISEYKFRKLVCQEKYDALDFVMNSLLIGSNRINSYKYEVALKLGSELCKSWLEGDNWDAVRCFLEWCHLSEHQIAKFKYEVVDKFSVTAALVVKGNYETINQFWKWCHRTEQEVNDFKTKFAYQVFPKIITTFRRGANNYILFFKFVNFCFESEEDVKEFRRHIMSEKQNDFSINIKDLLLYNYDFDSASRLVAWCFQYDNKIEEFKSNFLRCEGFDIFQRFTTNFKVYDSEFNHWTLVLELAQFFSPLQKDVIDKFKRSVLRERSIMFEPEKCSPFFTPKGKERALFYLLDNFSRKSDNDNAFNCGLDYREDLEIDKEGDSDSSDVMSEHKDYDGDSDSGIHEARDILTGMCGLDNIHYEGTSLEIADFLSDLLSEVEYIWLEVKLPNS